MLPRPTPIPVIIKTVLFSETPDLSVRPGHFYGAVSEEAKRTQRGSKEVAKRTQRGPIEEAMRRKEHKPLIVKQQQLFPRRIYQLSLLLPKSVPGFRGQRHIFCMTGAGAIYFCFISGSEKSFRLRLSAPMSTADKKQITFFKK
jgi:hypothetical protein